MVTVLGDTGKTLDVKYNGPVIDWSKFKPRQKYNFTFNYVDGRYSYLNVVGISA